VVEAGLIALARELLREHPGARVTIELPSWMEESKANEEDR
jgi:hypothetical protein